MNNSSYDLDYLLSPDAIRMSSAAIYKWAQDGNTHFEIHEDLLEKCALFVVDVIQENYPHFDVPFHSRWQHFQVGKKENPDIDRLQKIEESIKKLSPIDQAKAKWDFIIPSVLLDAGSGTQWNYFDKEYKQSYSKSEGLALASLQMYFDGYFKNASTLLTIDKKVIEKYFQVTEKNPLVGVEGRVKLIQNLGNILKTNHSMFPNGRVSDLLDFLLKTHGSTVSAIEVLQSILTDLGKIWPGRLVIHGQPIGDIWVYEPLSSKENFLVPFHKLSQWLTYSLLEPLVQADIDICDVEKLTGLAEYRNGGLFYDFGVIALKNKKLEHIIHEPQSDLVIEWRALTICLLDKLATVVQKRINKNAIEFPLAKVLEGGTWWAGRKIAKLKRPDGAPPLKIQSDGTIF